MCHIRWARAYISGFSFYYQCQSFASLPGSNRPSRFWPMWKRQCVCTPRTLTSWWALTLWGRRTPSTPSCSTSTTCCTPPDRTPRSACPTSSTLEKRVRGWMAQGTVGRRCSDVPLSKLLEEYPPLSVFVALVLLSYFVSSSSWAELFCSPKSIRLPTTRCCSCCLLSLLLLLLVVLIVFVVVAFLHVLLTLLRLYSSPSSSSSSSSSDQVDLRKRPVSQGALIGSALRSITIYIELYTNNVYDGAIVNEDDNKLELYKWWRYWWCGWWRHW